MLCIHKCYCCPCSYECSLCQSDSPFSFLSPTAVCTCVCVCVCVVHHKVCIYIVLRHLTVSKLITHKFQIGDN